MKSFAPFAFSLVAVGSLLTFGDQDSKYREPTLRPGVESDPRYAGVMSVPIERYLTDDHSMEARGTVYVGPPAKVQVAFLGFPKGALVRSIAYEIRFLQDDVILGNWSGLEFRADDDSAGFGITMPIFLHEAGSPVTTSGHVVEFEFAPIPDKSWLSVAQKHDVRVDVSMSDFQAPVIENPKPWKSDGK